MTLKFETVTLDASVSGIRIDIWLQQQFPQHSRSWWQKQIAHGCVLVNQQVVNKHYKLQVGDEITVLDTWATKTPPTNSSTLTIPIIFEDEALVVIDKPMGVLAHSVLGSTETSIARWVAEHYSEAVSLPGNDDRPGIMHRLDKPVSGVMVIAKTALAMQKLAGQFRSRQIRKVYQAIVHGLIDEVGTIQFPLTRSVGKSGKMVVRPMNDNTAKTALTSFTRLGTIGQKYSRLQVALHTGRMHQIRVHLAALDHPIVGDTLYTTKTYAKRGPYPRLFLHSWQLGFYHPTTKQWVEFEAPVPETFGEVT